MSRVEPLVPEQFRPDDLEIQKDPYPYYPLLREQAPVLKSKVGDQPCWILSRREDIFKAYMDPVTFSSRTTPIPNMLFSDEPEHGRLRRMVAHMFTRTAIQPMQPRIAAKAEELVDALLHRGSGDVIEDFAGPLTITMIGLTLGIPVIAVDQLRALTRSWTEYVLAVQVGAEPSGEARRGNDDLTAFVADIIRARRHDDVGVVATLAAKLEQGELTEQDCAQFAVLLLIAGHTTTTNLIGNSIYTLACRPGDHDRMGEDSFVQAFVEEVLRTRPSFHRNVRIATRDVEIAGKTIPAGGIVRLLLASANRDPASFEDPETFNPTLNRRQHLAFGQGIHTCLGNWLARLEARTALSVFARRIASVSLDPRRPPSPLTGGTFNEFGFEHLPVRVVARDAGSRKEPARSADADV